MLPIFIIHKNLEGPDISTSWIIGSILEDKSIPRLPESPVEINNFGDDISIILIKLFHKNREQRKKSG